MILGNFTKRISLFLMVGLLILQIIQPLRRGNHMLCLGRSGKTISRYLMEFGPGQKIIFNTEYRINYSHGYGSKTTKIINLAILLPPLMRTKILHLLYFLLRSE